MGCAWTHWYDWDTTACAGVANWDTLSYYFNGIEWTAYWFLSHDTDWMANTTLALKILKDKIDSLGEPEAIDMSAILKAMWEAKPYECLLFVPMVDAMRGSIWNKTVTPDWMANAMRHFAE